MNIAEADDVIAGYLRVAPSAWCLRCAAAGSRFLRPCRGAMLLAVPGDCAARGGVPSSVVGRRHVDLASLLNGTVNRVEQHHSTERVLQGRPSYG